MRAFILALVFVGAVSAQQVFENVELNAKYTTPAGWAMEAHQNTLGGFTITATRPGLQPVYVEFNKVGSAVEGYLFRGSYLFNKLNAFFDLTGSSAQAPLLTSSSDTTLFSGIGYSGAIIKHIDLNTVAVIYTSSFKTYVQTFWYVTTPADLNTNSTLYYMNWENTLFLTLNPTTNTSAVPFSQPVEKKMAVDILGRRLPGESAHRSKIPQLIRR